MRELIRMVVPVLNMFQVVEIGRGKTRYAAAHGPAFASACGTVAQWHMLITLGI